MPPRRLREGARAREQRRNAGLAARRVPAVDERVEWVEREVLADRHADPEPDRAHPVRVPKPLEGKPEKGSVEGVHGEADGPPAPSAGDRLPQQGDVGIVVTKQPLVERLEEPPDGRSRRAGRRRSRAAPRHSPSSRRNEPPPTSFDACPPAASRRARSDVTSHAPGNPGASRISQSSALSPPVPTSVVIESRRSEPTIPPGAWPSKTSTTSRSFRRAQSPACATSPSSARL